MIAAENDKDSRHVLFLASDQACASIHQLIQIFAIDRFNQNPATLGPLKINSNWSPTSGGYGSQATSGKYDKSTVIIDFRSCDFLNS